MKVIGINGSARKDGNTSLLIKAVFAELEAEGIETDLVLLRVRGEASMRCKNRLFQGMFRQNGGGGRHGARLPCLFRRCYGRDEGFP